MDPLTAITSLSSSPLDPTAAAGQSSAVLQHGNGASFAFHLPQPISPIADTAAVAAPSEAYAVSTDPSSSIGSIARDMINQANQLDTVAGEKVRDVLMGGPTTVNDAMVAEEESSVAFKLVSQVRNQVVTSYQQIMSMQI